MSLVFVIWLATVVPDIKYMFTVSAGISLATVVACVIGWLISHDSAVSTPDGERFRKTINKVLKRALLPVVLISAIFSAVLPDDEGIKWIVGAYLVQEGYNSIKEIDGIEQLPENLVRYINDFFEDAEKKSSTETGTSANETDSK